MLDHQPVSCLVASDLSPRGDRAIVRAFRIAERGRGRVDVLHIVEEDYPRRLTQTLVAEADSELRAQIAAMPESKGVHWTVTVECGHDHERIVEVAARRSVDLLILGGRRQPKISDLFLASTAQRVIRQSSVPVLIVKQPYRGPYGMAVAAVDASPHSTEAVRFALDVFPEVLVSAVHVTGLPGDPDARTGVAGGPGDDPVVAGIAGVLNAIPRFDLRGTFDSRSGGLLETFQVVVDERRPDLVVCGRSKSAKSFFLGEDLAGFAMLNIDRDMLIMP